MRKIFFTVLLFTVFVCIALGQSRKDRGDAFVSEGDYGAAAEMYSQCMEDDDECFIKYVKLLIEEKIAEQSSTELFGLLHQRANRGNAESQYLLGTLYLDGKGGVGQNYDKAIEWFNKAIIGDNFEVSEKARAAKSRVERSQRRAKQNDEEVYTVENRGNVYNSTNDEAYDQDRGYFMLMPGISFGNKTSYSVMAGYVKEFGGYVKVKSSFDSKDKNAMKGGKDDAFFNGNEFSGRFSFYGGLLFKLSSVCYMNAGVGYGSKWLQWETMNEERMEIEDFSFSGIDPEVGLLFKFGNFIIGGGVNCLIGGGTSALEGNISIGVAF